MGTKIPVIFGKGGNAEAEVFIIGDAANLVIGRSRTCAISFQRFEYFVNLPEAKQRELDQLNNAVSREHLRVRTAGTKLILENLGAGGSTCDGRPITGIHEVDLVEGQSVTLRLGQASESFEVTLIDDSQIEQVLEDGNRRRKARIAELPKPAAAAAAAGPGAAKAVVAARPSPNPTSVTVGPSIAFATAGGMKTVPFTGSCVSEALQGANPPFEPYGSCGGAPACWGCKYQVIKGAEHVVWSEEGYKENVSAGQILGCQCSVKGPVQVERVVD